MFTFERALPEEVSISSKSIKKVMEYLDKKNVPMHSLLIMKDDRLIFEKYYAPYKADTFHRMFSISKSFVSIAIGLLTMEGKLSLDDPIVSYFPEYVGESTHPYIKMMTIRNMLMMRTCHAKTTYKVDMKSDWVRSFFEVTPSHKPGTVFHYDTSASHVLCALVEKLTGKEMLTYMKDALLKHLDFSEDSYMLKDPFGVSMGGSGLMATPMDILKILYLLDKKGEIVCSDGQKRTLLPKEYIEEATKNLSDTMSSMTGTIPIPSEAQGYGMMMWQNEKGGFVLYGMGGQLAISIPSRHLLIVTTADTQGMPAGNQLIYHALYENLLSNDTELNPADYKELCLYADKLSIAPPKLPEGYSYTGPFTAPGFIPDCIKEKYKPDSDGRISISYELKPNAGGFETLSLLLSENAPCTISLERKKSLHNISFGIQNMCEGSFPIYNNAYTAGAVWTRENTLYIRIHLIGESVGSVHFQLFFEENEISAFVTHIEETYYKEYDGHLEGLLIKA